MEKKRAGKRDQGGTATEGLAFQEGGEGRSHWQGEICPKTWKRYSHICLSSSILRQGKPQMLKTWDRNTPDVLKKQQEGYWGQNGVSKQKLGQRSKRMGSKPVGLWQDLVFSSKQDRVSLEALCQKDTKSDSPVLRDHSCYNTDNYKEARAKQGYCNIIRKSWRRLKSIEVMKRGQGLDIVWRCNWQDFLVCWMWFVKESRTAPSFGLSNWKDGGRCYLWRCGRQQEGQMEDGIR